MPDHSSREEPRRFPDPAREPEGRVEDAWELGTEGGHAAPGEREGNRGQLDGASGGYGSRSGVSSGGTGDGEAGAGVVTDGMDDGTSSSASGATDEAPTEWLRQASGGGSEKPPARPR